MIKQYNLKNVYSNLIKCNTNILNTTYKFNISNLDNELLIKTNTIKFLLDNYNITDKKEELNKNIIKLDVSIKALNTIKTSTLYKSIDYYKRYIKSLEYDNLTHYDIHIKPLKVMYEKDIKKYRFINKKVKYKDISIFQILKLLNHTHKINKYDFKNSIKRLKENKPLKNKIKGYINGYFKTLKSNSSKNSITGLKRTADKRNFEIMKINNTAYKVITKSYYNTYKSIYTQLYKNKIPILNIKLNSEFKHRLENSNKLVFQDNTISL